MSWKGQSEKLMKSVGRGCFKGIDCLYNNHICVCVCVRTRSHTCLQRENKKERQRCHLDETK